LGIGHWELGIGDSKRVNDILKMVKNSTFMKTKTKMIKPLPLIRGEVGEGFYIKSDFKAFAV
jgi:hypothetical protein